ncbi:MAG TPA: hypothetical protein VF981_07980 [Gemmatimonadaceae bacterium]
MSWTTEDKVEWMLRLPWRVKITHEDDGTLFAQAEDLDGAVADGANPEELEQSFWDSLRETLRAYLAAGDPIPLPGSPTPPWDAPSPQRTPLVRVEGIELAVTDPLTSAGESLAAA